MGSKRAHFVLTSHLPRTHFRHNNSVVRLHILERCKFELPERYGRLSRICPGLFPPYTARTYKEYSCRNEAYLLLQMVIFLWPLGNNHFVAKFLRDRQKCSFFERRMAYLRQAFSRRRKRQKLRHTASLTYASALGRRRRRYLRNTHLSDICVTKFDHI